MVNSGRPSLRNGKKFTTWLTTTTTKHKRQYKAINIKVLYHPEPDVPHLLQCKGEDFQRKKLGKISHWQVGFRFWLILHARNLSTTCCTASLRSTWALVEKKTRTPLQFFVVSVLEVQPVFGENINMFLIGTKM